MIMEDILSFFFGFYPPLRVLKRTNLDREAQCRI